MGITTSNDPLPEDGETVIDLKPAHRALAHRPRHANAIRLYWWLWFELDSLEYKPVKVVRMAQALTMDKGQVSRAIRTLLGYGLIQRNGRAWSRGPFTYRLVLNPPDPTIRENTTTQAA